MMISLVVVGRFIVLVCSIVVPPQCNSGDVVVGRSSRKRSTRQHLSRDFPTAVMSAPNFVAKNMETFNRPVTREDKKRAAKKSGSYLPMGVDD
jgi:hypothetical protein